MNRVVIEENSLNIELASNPCVEYILAYGGGYNPLLTALWAYRHPQSVALGIQLVLPAKIKQKAGFPALSWIIRVSKALYFVTICYRKFALNRVICSYEFRNFVAHSTENPLRFENDVPKCVISLALVFCYYINCRAIAGLWFAVAINVAAACCKICC